MSNLQHPITPNYLKIQLNILQPHSRAVLIHCQSIYCRQQNRTKRPDVFMDGSQKAANVPHDGVTGHSSFIFCQICFEYRLLTGKLWSCWKGNDLDQVVADINTLALDKMKIHDIFKYIFLKDDKYISYKLWPRQFQSKSNQSPLVQQTGNKSLPVEMICSISKRHEKYDVHQVQHTCAFGVTNVIYWCKD